MGNERLPVDPITDYTVDDLLKFWKNGKVQIVDPANPLPIEATFAGTLVAENLTLGGSPDGGSTRIPILTDEAGSAVTKNPEMMNFLENGFMALVSSMLTSLGSSVDGLEPQLQTLVDQLAYKGDITALQSAVTNLLTDIRTRLNGTVGVSLSGEIYVLSTDTKPTPASTWRGYLIETDTGKIYSWSGSVWVVKS